MLILVVATVMPTRLSFGAGGGICCPRARLPDLGTVDIWDQMITAGGCLVHGEMFSSIPALYPLARSRTPSLDNQKHFQTLSNVP